MEWKALYAFKNGWKGDFPGSAMVMISPSNERGSGSIPGQGAKIPHASQPRNQNIKQKQYCNKSITDFKNGKKKKEREREWLEINRKNMIWNVLINIWNVHLRTNLQKANGIKWSLLLSTHWKLPFKGKVGHGDSWGNPARSELRSTPVCRWVQVPHLGFPFSAIVWPTWWAALPCLLHFQIGSPVVHF